jgi:hypothetical protein
MERYERNGGLGFGTVDAAEGKEWLAGASEALMHQNELASCVHVGHRSPAP